MQLKALGGGEVAPATEGESQTGKTEDADQTASDKNDKIEKKNMILVF